MTRGGLAWMNSSCDEDNFLLTFEPIRPWVGMGKQPLADG